MLVLGISDCTSPHLFPSLLFHSLPPYSTLRLDTGAKADQPFDPNHLHPPSLSLSYNILSHHARSSGKCAVPRVSRCGSSGHAPPPPKAHADADGMACSTDSQTKKTLYDKVSRQLSLTRSVLSQSVDCLMDARSATREWSMQTDDSPCQ